MSKIFTYDNANIVIGIITILIALIPSIYKVLLKKRKINISLNSGINYRLNDKIEEARKEFNKALEYEHCKIFKKLIIKAKINLYETYHYDMINREKSLEYAKVNEEDLLKELPDYGAKKSIMFSKYKYQYAVLNSNLGHIYNELALFRDAKSNYECSKKYSLQSIDIFRKINRLNNFYFSTFGTSYSNLAITFKGLANLNKDSRLLQLSLNNAKYSLSIYEKIKDYINIARIQNNIGNIYSDLIKFKNNENEREKIYSSSEDYLCKSLEFYNIEKYPYEFAMSHQNLGSLNLHMMCYSDDKDKIYLYYIKSEKNYDMCKKVFIKDKFENEYINLYYNLMSLYFQAFKRIGDMNLLPKVVDNGNVIFEICTIENKPILYIDTNLILADAYFLAIETCEFVNENEKIDMMLETISKYEIVMGSKELSIRSKVNTITKLIRLNMTILDMTDSIIYKEKCDIYCKEMDDVIKANPEVLNEISFIGNL